MSGVDEKTGRDRAGQDRSGRGSASARARARWLVPVIASAMAPLVLALAIHFTASRQVLDILGWNFMQWLGVCLYFVPAIAAASTWQVRLLTAGEPLHGRALTGMSLVMSVVLALVGLAVTLVILTLYAWVVATLLWALPPHVALQFLLRFALQGLILFLVFAPSFMIGGALLGWFIAAFVHQVYGLNRLAELSVDIVRPAAVVGGLLALGIYRGIAQGPSMPVPDPDGPVQVQRVGAVVRTLLLRNAPPLKNERPLKNEPFQRL